MIKSVTLKRPEYTADQLEQAREMSLNAVKEWREAQAELERICKELGLEVPVMVCKNEQ